MEPAPDSTIEELREWLEQGGQVEAAEALQTCDIRTRYVDEVVEIGASGRMWSLFDVEIAAPRQVYEPLDDRHRQIRTEIENCVRAHGEANGVAVRSVEWLAKFGASQRSPAQAVAEEVLQGAEAAHVSRAWRKALHRRTFDPDGAITAAKSMLEAVCKHILASRDVTYSSSADLPKLWHLTLQELHLAPAQQDQRVWRQVLGHCEAIVGALAAIRNDHGDAHGPCPGYQTISPVYAELAVNLAGSVASFVVSVWRQQVDSSEHPLPPSEDSQ
ncbi:MAG TPA: abortive infection family protein [Thermoanaerobaculia bacterium]|nr:abortive infection family protein [Thermoanaerobaculia bacterium]